MNKVSIQQEYLRTDAMNNLGYLHYMGMGTPRMVQRAVELWSAAFNRGHQEAAYHLCHVYADPKAPEYLPELGRSYCLEALRRYGAMRDSDRENAGLMEHIQAYLSALPEQ